MPDHLQRTLGRIDRNTRIGIVASAVWLVLALATCFYKGSHLVSEGGWREREVIEVGMVIPNYLVFGILPVILSWGVVWIRRAK